ncbi:MAG: ElyC/SanA/YdcF family protein, partial [Planctomycetota bacterium]
MTSGTAASPKHRDEGSRRSRFRPCVLSVVATGVVAAVLVLWSWIVGGRGFADRAITDLVMPIGLLWLASFTTSFYGFFSRSRRLLFPGMFAWFFVTLSFSDPIANALMRTVEIPANEAPVSQLDEPVDVVVLLGGYADVDRFGTLELGTDGQRLFLTAQLFKSGKAKAIVCTGSAHFGDYHPSRVGRELLESIGVPSDAIFEVPGINTSQEMR